MISMGKSIRQIWVNITFFSDEGIEVLCVGDRVTRGANWEWEDEVIPVGTWRQNDVRSTSHVDLTSF